MGIAARHPSYGSDQVKTMKFISFILVASISVPAAIAQTTLPVPIASAPRHQCARPQMLDMSKRVTKSEMAAFVQSLNKFKECAEAFAQAQQIESERVQRAAQASAESLVASGNAAIKDYNDFVEEAGKVMASKPSVSKGPVEPAPKGTGETPPSRTPGKN